MLLRKQRTVVPSENGYGDASVKSVTNGSPGQSGVARQDMDARQDDRASVRRETICRNAFRSRTSAVGAGAGGLQGRHRSAGETDRLDSREPIHSPEDRSPLFGARLVEWQQIERGTTDACREELFHHLESLDTRSRYGAWREALVAGYTRSRPAQAPPPSVPFCRHPHQAERSL